ncbi:MAG: hypothetical protein NVSMB38_40490 [Ktedonobacteraceae bacterium]
MTLTALELFHHTCRDDEARILSDRNDYLLYEYSHIEYKGKNAARQGEFFTQKLDGSHKTTYDDIRELFLET